MKKKLLGLVTAAVTAAMCFALVGCDTSNQARFVTGGESGTYYAYGTVLAQYATNNTDVTINALSSEGSKTNVDSLASADAELAFCQLDVASYSYSGTNLFEGMAYDGFSLVAALYPEQVQIVTCNADIKSVADLKGKTISVGAANSGVYFNAVDILSAYDLTMDDINPVYQGFGDSTDSLKNNKIDAAFVTAGAPTTSITDLSTSNPAYLVSLDDEHIAKLQESCPYYEKAVIKGGTYSTMTEDTTTVSVLSVILADDSVDDELVYQFTKSIFEGAEAQPDAHAKYSELSLDTSTSVTSIPYAKGAAKYYEEVGIQVPTK